MNLIERWAQAQDLGPVSNNRRFAVTIDQVRIHLLELHPGQVVLEARIADVPTAPAVHERTLERAMQIALARARESRSHLMVDDDQAAFWLQRCIRPGAGLEELDQDIGELVNDIELWRSAL
jgi:hypothetical protein